MRPILICSVAALCGGWMTACATARPAPLAAPAPPVEQVVAEQPNVDDAFKDAFRPIDAPPDSPENIPVASPAQTSPTHSEYAGRLAEVQKALASGSPTQASALLPQLTKVAQALGESERREALGVGCQVALAMGDRATAATQARQWLASCGPEKLDECRAAARQELKATAVAGTPEAASLESELAEAAALDACVVAAEGSTKARASSKCLSPALLAFQHQNDSVMVARVQLLLASDARTKDAELKLLSGVATGCTEPRCSQVRQLALRRIGEIQLARRDYRAAATSALQQMHEATELLPVEARRHARTREVERACAAYERHSEHGACKALEVALFGTYSLPDLSLEKADKPYLTAAVIKRATAQYQDTLYDCVLTAAAHLGQPAYVNFNLHWVVRGDGRVVFAETDSSELNSSETGACLRGAFGLWRYPRFGGEPQHIRQNFRLLVSKAPPAVARADGAESRGR